MLIICEGVDGIGKSTFANMLAELIPEKDDGKIFRLHAGPPKAHPIDEYVVPILEIEDQVQTNEPYHIICDRWHWGETVYAQVLGRRTQMTPAVFRWIELFLLSRGALVVHMTTSVNTAQMWLKQRGDDMIQEAMIPPLHALYNAMRFKSILPVHHSNLTNHATWKDAEASIGAALMQRVENVKGLMTYVGPPRPSTLLVGDTRSESRHLHHYAVPAFAPYGNTSGKFLMEAVSSIRAVERPGIINANDVDSLDLAYTHLGRPHQTVALGRRASGALSRLGIEHSSVPHPQFIKRFFCGRQEEYSIIIEEAVKLRKDHLGWRP